jgi:GTPase involved in cell partitioning and DNA repair
MAGPDGGNGGKRRRYYFLKCFDTLKHADRFSVTPSTSAVKKGHHGMGEKPLGRVRQKMFVVRVPVGNAGFWTKIKKTILFDFYRAR